MRNSSNRKSTGENWSNSIPRMKLIDTALDICRFWNDLYHDDGMFTGPILRKSTGYGENSKGISKGKETGEAP